MSCSTQRVAVSDETYDDIFYPSHVIEETVGINCIFQCTKLGDDVLSAAYDDVNLVCSCLRTAATDVPQVTDGVNVFIVHIRRPSKKN